MDEFPNSSIENTGEEMNESQSLSKVYQELPSQRGIFQKISMQNYVHVWPGMKQTLNTIQLLKK